MALVTDSFCERCGTRYVFQAPSSKALSIKSARTLARGLRNFVMNDGQSLEDSMNAARVEGDSVDSGRLTDAFHRAFNFCMSCRQYACDRCWNAKAGACLSCAPDASSTATPEHDRLIVRTPVTRVDDFPGRPIAGLRPEPAPAKPAWPEADLATPETPAADHSVVDAGTGALPAAPRTPEWRLRRGSVDGESAEQVGNHWNLWPLSDPLAPEATLTPEEMSLIQEQLSRTDPTFEPQQAVEATPLSDVPEPPAEPVLPAPVIPAAEPFVPAPVAPPAAARPAAGRFVVRTTDESKPPLPKRTTALRGTSGNGKWPTPTPWLDRPIKSYGFLFDDEPADTWAADAATPPPAAAPDVTPEVVTPEVVAPEVVAPEVLAPLAAGAEAVSWSDAQPAAPVQQPAEAIDLGLWATPEPLPAPEPVAASMPDEPAPAPAAEPEPVSAEPQPIVFREIPSGIAWQERMVAAQLAAQPNAEPLTPASAPAAPQPVPPQPIATPVSQPAAYVEQSHPAWPPLGAQWPAPAPQSPVWPGPDGVAAPAAVLSAVTAATTEMWAQSAQEVMNRGTVRVCHHCSLPLSTHARFCRRCGTSQN